MMRRWFFPLVLVAAIAGCSPAPMSPLTEPMMEATVEPITEPEIVAAREPEGVAGPVVRPRARPVGLDLCNPGDDGIGGTGCPVD